MSEQDTITELAETLEGLTYVRAQVAGLEWAARVLREKAGDAWKRDRDERAEVYRNVAREFEKIAQEKDTDYRQARKGERDAAYEKLEALDLELAQLREGRDNE